MASNFRKIDIDQFDEDVLNEEELYDPDPRDPSQVLADTKQKASAVRGYLTKCVFQQHSIARIMLTFSDSRGDVTGAINLVLDSAPYGPNVEEAKVCTFTTHQATDFSYIIRRYRI